MRFSGLLSVIRALPHPRELTLHGVTRWLFCVGVGCRSRSCHNQTVRSQHHCFCIAGLNVLNWLGYLIYIHLLDFPSPAPYLSDDIKSPRSRPFVQRRSTFLSTTMSHSYFAIPHKAHPHPIQFHTAKYMLRTSPVPAVFLAIQTDPVEQDLAQLCHGDGRGGHSNIAGLMP